MSLQRALEELTAGSGSVSFARLAELSGLTPQEQRAFEAAWAAAPAFRRRTILAALVDLAEDNVELEFTAIFRHALQDTDDEVRILAISGLWECEERSLIAQLIRLLQTDPAERVRIASAQALGRFALLAETGKLLRRDGERVGAALLGVVSNQRETLDVRRRAIEAVASMSLPQVPKIIEDAYEHEEARVRASALFAMGRSCNPRWLSTLIDELESSDPEMRYEAAGALGELGEEEAVEYLIPLFHDPDAQVQSAAFTALGAIGGPVAKKALLRARDEGDAVMAEMADAALQAIQFDDDPLRGNMSAPAAMDDSEGA